MRDDKSRMIQEIYSCHMIFYKQKSIQHDLHHNNFIFFMSLSKFSSTICKFCLIIYIQYIIYDQVKDVGKYDITVGVLYYYVSYWVDRDLKPLADELNIRSRIKRRRKMVIWK